MRIIAGELKGRRLTTPAHNSIRPTTDKVKESLFSIITPYLPEAVVVDLFAGTGSLGLEAVSRGASTVYFGDKSRSSMRIIRKNISDCGVESRCKTILGDWEQVIKEISQPVDIIILDPPYQFGSLEECITKIIDLSLIKEDGIIVAEHGSDQILPLKIGNLTKYKGKKYGTIYIDIYAIMEE